MIFNIEQKLAHTAKTDCVIIGIDTTAYQDINKASNGYLTDLTVNKTLLLHRVPNITATWVLLVKCGEKQAKFISNTVNKLKEHNITTASCYLPLTNLFQALITIGNILYIFDEFKSIAEDATYKIDVLSFAGLNITDNVLQQGLATINGMNLTKDLGNSPPNICTPSFLAQSAKNLAKEYKNIKTDILETKDMQKLGMHALLAVTKGSAQPPKLITMQYLGADDKKQQPIVLVGKGVTFDSGGLSLKPPGSMVGMKYDMCGAATVFGVLKTIAELKLPINVVGIVPSVENMPSSTAITPDAIVNSMAGLTIEILNTDAEGRLILCDALTYAKRFTPKAVIDIATLTGACVVALGKHISALFSNDETLATELTAAGEVSYDRCWRMPMSHEYHEQIKSNFADLANIGTPGAGSITAACFLSRFTEDYPWAHLDVAGTACNFEGKDKQARGRPVPLLVQYLLTLC